MTILNSSELLGWSEFSQLDDAINPEASDLGKLLAKRGAETPPMDPTQSVDNAMLDSSELLGWSEFAQLDPVNSPNEADLGKLLSKRGAETVMVSQLSKLFCKRSIEPPV